MMPGGVPGEEHKAPAVRELSIKGKKTLLEAIDEYVDKKIELFFAKKSTQRVNYLIMEEELKKARENLFNMLIKLEIRLE